MKTIERPTVPFEVVDAKLAADDDRGFWRSALSVLTDEFAQRHLEGSATRDWTMVIGGCSHWVKPHQKRWTAAGGFAYPDGYREYLPEFDWSLILVFRDNQWMPLVKLPGKHPRIFGAALPTRTARHNQAAVHTRWFPGEETVLFGFRKINQRWKCVAASDEKTRGRIALDSRAGLQGSEK
jgi:hypothetical protein